MRKVLDLDPNPDVIDNLGDIASEVRVYDRWLRRYRSRVCLKPKTQGFPSEIWLVCVTSDPAAADQLTSFAQFRRLHIMICLTEAPRSSLRNQYKFTGLVAPLRRIPIVIKHFENLFLRHK
jgi:hypothetical protein